jgi:hypothetical protein
MNRGWVRILPILGVAFLAWAHAYAQDGIPMRSTNHNAERLKASSWAAQVLGRHYYLKSPDYGLLANDQVDIVRCDIRYSPVHESDEQRESYRAKLWLQGASPAPPVQFRLSVADFDALAKLDRWLEGQFSTEPLEDAYEWPPEVKTAVRYRYLVLGMDKEMVGLALGGLPYQVDLEKLDDGRVRETWKLQVIGDTRRIFTRRSTYMSTLTTQVNDVLGSFSSISQALTPRTVVTNGTMHASGSTSILSSTSISEAGSFVFSGLPPQFLHIVFTDNRVTARRTEFIK